MSAPPLRYETDGATGRILLDRAGKKNAMTVAMWRRLAELSRAAAADGGPRVLLLESADPSVFCAGADLAEFRTMIDDPALRADSHDAMLDAMTAMADFPRPTLAVVGGDCMGAGVALAAACDLRIAGPGARFATTPAKLGLVYPDSDIARIARLIGPAALKRLLFTAMPIDAAEAHRIGLVDILSDAATPQDDAAALAARIAANSAASLQAMKRVLDRGPDAPERARETFLARYDSEDFAAALGAFLSRR